MTERPCVGALLVRRRGAEISLRVYREEEECLASGLTFFRALERSPATHHKLPILRVYDRQAAGPVGVEFHPSLLTLNSQGWVLCPEGASTA